METILINPTDLEESLTHILLATRDGTKEALPLNTNYKFKVEHFSNHPTQVFLYKKPRHPMMGLKKHCDNGSPNSIRNPPLPSRETLPKKSSFHKMHAHVLEAVSPIAWTENQVFPPQADYHGQLH